MKRPQVPFTSLDDMFERLHITPKDGWEEESQDDEDEDEDGVDTPEEEFFWTDEDNDLDD